MNLQELQILKEQTKIKYEQQFENHKSGSLQTISYDQAAQILEIPRNHPILMTLYEAADGDGNTVLEHDEFEKICVAYELLLEADPKKVKTAIFVLADLNNDGVIDKKEAQRIARIFGMHKYETQQLVEEIESAGGNLEYYRFLDALK